MEKNLFYNKKDEKCRDFMFANAEKNLSYEQHRIQLSPTYLAISQVTWQH
jgi:hypothetical protein